MNPFERPVPGKFSVGDILYWVYEREMIRIRKVANAEPPYTDDPILSKYRFCNVRRRDDRVSQWLINNAYPRDVEMDDLWLTAAICRYVGWPPSILKLMEAGAIPEHAEDFNSELFAEVLDKMTAAGEKTWTGAYMTYPTHADPGTTKGWRTAKFILEPLITRAVSIREAIRTNSLENTFKSIVGSFGFSEFMSMQLVADLAYAPPLENASDLYTFAARGPGSQRGLNRLNGRKLDAKWRHEAFLTELVKVNELIECKLGMKLVLTDVQSVFCELDKYWRVLNGEGVPRSKYTPETAY